MTHSNSYDYRKILLPEESSELAFIDIGQGDNTIIFLHGIGNISFVWHKNISELSKYYRCIAVDLPGNGQSALIDKTYTLEYFADSIAYLIQQLKLEKVHLTGHSMGGQTALIFALKYPHLLHSLILCAPAGFETFNTWEAKLFEVMMGFVDVTQKESHFRNAITLSFHKKPKDAEWLIAETVKSLDGKNETLYRRMLEDCVKSMLKHKVYSRLHEIKIPVLVLFGENDNYIPIKAIHPLLNTKIIALEGAAKLPNAQLKLFENCGHSLQWEKYEEVNAQMLNFIEGL